MRCPVSGECPTAISSGQDAYDEVPCFRGVPYSDIIQQWLMLTGGEPVKGERNTRLHRLAYHLRYIADDDETLIKRILPRYGLGDREIDSLVHSACMAKFCSTPTEMKKAVQAAFALAAVQNSNSASAGSFGLYGEILLHANRNEEGGSSGFRPGCSAKQQFCFRRQLSLFFSRQCSFNWKCCFFSSRQCCIRPCPCICFCCWRRHRGSYE